MLDVILDWILFLLSVWGAVMLSGGNILLGFFALLLIYGALRLIKWIIVKAIELNRSNRASRNAVSNSIKSYASVGIRQGHLELVLDMVMKFLDAYAMAVPDEWYLFFISQETKRTEYSDRYYTYDGYLKFEVSVGTWWNGMLKSPEVEDYMKTTFNFDPEHKKFTYAGISTGSSTCCAFPRDQVNEILQKYLDEYEAKHPGVRFKRENWGASITQT